MQIKKEQANGALYQMGMYSAGVMTLHTPAQRARRTRITSEYKQLINKTHRREHLMRLVSLNFTPGRDNFVEFGYSDEKTPEECEKMFSNFHRAAKRQWAKYGADYCYIANTEAHGRNGERVRPHHHAIIRGIPGVDMRQLLQDLWKHGGVDVRTLREFTAGFKDTAIYMGKRRFKRCF